VEFAKEPVQDSHNVEVPNEVSMADAPPKICDTIGKQQNVDESIDSKQPTHSQLHHLDCLHLQEMEQCVQSVESTASQLPWSTSCSLTQRTVKPSKPTLKRTRAGSNNNSGIASMSDSSICFPNLAMPMEPAQAMVTEAQAVDILLGHESSEYIDAFESSPININPCDSSVKPSPVVVPP